MASDKKGFIERLKAIYHLAARAYGQYKLEIILLAVLGFFGGILEGIGINALIPLLSFIVEGGTPTDFISEAIRSVFIFLHIDFAPKFLLYFIVILFLGKAVIGFFLDYIRVRIASEYERETREKLFSAQIKSSWPHLLKQKLGHLETLILVDVPGARNVLVQVSSSIVLLTSLLMYAVVVFNVSTVITLLTVAVGSLFIYLVRPISNRIRIFAGERARLQRETAHFVSEHLGGIKTVKAAAVEPEVLARGLQLFQDLKTRGMWMELLQAVGIALVPPLAILYLAGIFGLAFRYEIIVVSALPTIVYLIYRIFSYVQQLQSALQVINGSVPYLKNVLEYEDRALEKGEPTQGNEPFLLGKEIAFENVHFSYTGAVDVLHSLTFVVSKGSMVGIIGPSGAGKTTIVDLLLRLLEPTQGSITIDGVNSRAIDLISWRQKVAYVSQDLFLIRDTIRNNITFYTESISDDDIWEAVRMAHIDEFIKSRPEGLDAEVGERGVELSAGQRQRLVIARALVRKPEVLILDEATSSLDAESEAHIEQMLQELKGKMTIIVIAHRLSTIMNSDSLVVLADGRVAEEGVPTALLKNKDSYFFKVSNLQ